MEDPNPVRALLHARLNAGVSRRRFIGGAAGITALAAIGPSLLAACGTGSTSSSSPKLGGDLNFIGYDGEDAKNVAKSFFQTNGITMRPKFIADAFEPLTRFKTGQRGQLDIISDNKDFQRAVLATGEQLFTPLDMSRIPNAAGLFPAFAQAQWLTKDGKVYGIPLIWGDEPCIYNPKKWNGVPAKYTDFADRKYKGELSMVDDPIANTWLFGKSLGMSDPHLLTQSQLDSVMQAMRAVKPNIVTFSATLGDQADVLVRGDASMGIGGWAYQKLLAAQKGVTLVTANPADDGTYYWSDAYAIALGAPHIDNAYAFINFMMSPENSAAIAKELGSGATIAKAVDQMDDTNKNLYNYDQVRTRSGILATQIVSPPQDDQGDIVGVAKWSKAWEAYKLA